MMSQDAGRLGDALTDRHWTSRGHVPSAWMMMGSQQRRIEAHVRSTLSPHLPSLLSWRRSVFHLLYAFSVLDLAQSLVLNLHNQSSRIICSSLVPPRPSYTDRIAAPQGYQSANKYHFKS
jgi:hypothetical protein